MKQGHVPRLLILIGGGALLAAAAVDVIAVIGRHAGLPLRGSIELVQALVLLAGGIALLVTTRAGAHACVHLLVDRLPPAPRDALQRAGQLCGALFFLALCVASAWIARDLWSGHEESEWLRLPYRPLRIATVLFAAATAAAFIAATLRRRPR